MYAAHGEIVEHRQIRKCTSSQ